MSDFSVVLPITKVDAVQRLVYARATQEVPDKANEIMDYASSKPEFEKWSAGIHAASGGKSYGNIRAMHGKTAAGLLYEPLSFDDADKAVDAVVKVIDDQEWKKVESGVYTGLSIGGAYAKRWADPDNPKMMRFTAAPAEISLVDNPCVPTATFKLVKADGTEADQPFKQFDPENSVDQVWRAKDGSTFAKKADALAHNEKLAKQAVDPAATALATLDRLRKSLAGLEGGETLDDVRKRMFSNDERKRAAESGEAMPDGSFPIKNKGDLKNAIRAYGRAKDKDAAKKHIEARAKALGAEDMVPAGWDAMGKACEVTLTKGIWDVEQFMSIAGSIAELRESALMEAIREGDGSTVGSQLDALLSDVVAICTQWAGEELGELMESRYAMTLAGDYGSDDCASPMELAAQDVMAKFAVTPDMLKAGRRNSAGDMKRIQTMHDNATGLGAKCDHGNCDCPMDGKSAPTGDLAKVEDLASKSEVAELRKMVADRDSALTTVTAAMEDMAKRMERMERLPAVPAMPVRIVAKDGDGLTPSIDEPADERGLKARLASITDPQERARLLFSSIQTKKLR